MENMDLILTLYGCLILLAIFVEGMVQGLRKGKITGKIFARISPIVLSGILSLLLVIAFKLQFFNIVFSAMQAQIPRWFDSCALALVVSRGSSWIHEKANQIGMNRTV